MIVVMNQLTVPRGAGSRLEQAFRERASLSQAPGFVDFALLQEASQEDGGEQEQFVVLMRWADRASYDAWVAGDEFAKAHSGGNQRSPVRSTLTVYELLFERQAGA